MSSVCNFRSSEPNGFSMNSHCTQGQNESKTPTLYSQTSRISQNSQGSQNGSSRESEPDEESQKLAWRRLIMSRAKLKATAGTSELLSGFAMVAMVDLQITKCEGDGDMKAKCEWLYMVFSICTTLLVSVHIFALMISTYLLPSIEAISKLESTKLLKESPHEKMRSLVELAWIFAHVLGLFLFLVELLILCWVKFWAILPQAAWIATIIFVPVLVIFLIFVFCFYQNVVAYKLEATAYDVEELEVIKRKLDDASSISVIS